MDANLDASFPSIVQSCLLDKVLGFHCEFDHAHRMVTCEQTGVKIFLTEFETTAGDESFANSVNDLEAILFAKAVHSVVYLF